MENKPLLVIEWTIQNLRHWCALVHGNAIVSPKVIPPNTKYCESMELYPRGISGQENHLLVRLCGIKCAFSGDLSYIALDESFICTQQVNADAKKTLLELPPGPNFEEVLAKIVKNEDRITLRFRINSPICHEQLMCTTIDVIKISLKLNPKELLTTKINTDNCIISIPFSRFHASQGLNLFTRFTREKIQFMLEPKVGIISEISVDTCTSLINSEDTIESRGEKTVIFSNKIKWKFFDMVLKDLLERRITIRLGLKIKSLYMVRSHNGLRFIRKGVNIELNNNLYVPDESITCTQTEDSAVVLSKDFSALFQNQDFSDLLLKSGGVSFPVHKNILSARSPVFKRLLSSGMKETATGEVDIGDIDPSTLARFLAFLYAGTVEDLQGDSALQLYYVADKYEVLSLKRDCSDFLRTNVSISNVCDILSFADQHADEELGTVSKNFILDNYNAVLKSKEWEALTKSDPLLAVNTLTHFAVKDCVRKHNSL